MSTQVVFSRSAWAAGSGSASCTRRRRALSVELGLDGIGGIAHHLGQRNGLQIQLELAARVESRHLDELAHQPQQPLRFGPDAIGDFLALGRGQPLVAQQHQTEVDAGQRRFELVRNRGQKGRFQLVEVLEIGHVAQAKNVARRLALFQVLIESLNGP